MNRLDKLSAVVVWYNPDDVAVQNILTYNTKCSKIFIVDNSDSDNCVLAEKIPNAVYHSNMENKGIASALNTGCQHALDDGFDWCMTMDQDSSWEPMYIEKYVKAVSSRVSDKCISFSPRLNESVKSLVSELFGTNKSGDIENEFAEKDRAITSGNIVNLHVWQEIGKFNEMLFIDEVDHEFCYRLHDSGYIITECQNVFMNHKLGDVKKTILPRICKHSGVRLYYIFRNFMFIKKEFPDYFSAYKYNRYLFIAVVQKIMELKWQDISYMIKGLRDAKNGKFGKFE